MEVEAQSIRKLNRAIEDLSDLTGRNISTILIQATTRAARSAAKATKQAPKNRRKRDIRGRLLGQRKRGEIPWWADYRLQAWKQLRGGASRERMLYVTEEKLQRFLPVPNRGVAKKAWLGAAGRIKAQKNAVSPAARRYSRGRAYKAYGQVYKTAMENRVRYITKAGGNSADVGVEKATNWITGFAIPRAVEKLEAKWRREGGSVGN